jgi:hypothetical protein
MKYRHIDHTELASVVDAICETLDDVECDELTAAAAMTLILQRMKEKGLEIHQINIIDVKDNQ